MAHKSEKIKKRKKTQNTNLASEFYVASQLLRLGYNVTITLGHTKEIDLIVAHPDGRMVTIDVKGLKNTTNWPLKLKRKRKYHFYVLVTYHNKFGSLDYHPEVFVIPSLEIKKLITGWTGRREVTNVGYRQLRGDKGAKYRNGWSILFK